MIELKNISTVVQGRKILDDISLKINKGDIAIILGPSGAGKSSILKIMLGLWKASTGQVLIDGVDITKLNEREILPVRSRMAMVFQGNALFDSLSVEENVAYFLREHKKLSPKEIDDKVSEALSFVNLNGIQDMCVDQLSGGMKKRVAIARALSFDPEIVLYDEPTTGLDPINSKAILDLIKRVRDRGATSIVVTHILNDAISIGDQLSVIKDGKLVQTGTVHDLLESDNQFIRDFFYEVFQDAELLKNKNIK